MPPQIRIEVTIRTNVGSSVFISSPTENLM